MEEEVYVGAHSKNLNNPILRHTIESARRRARFYPHTRPRNSEEDRKLSTALQNVYIYIYINLHIRPPFRSSSTQISVRIPSRHLNPVYARERTREIERDRRVRDVIGEEIVKMDSRLDMPVRPNTSSYNQLSP